MKRILITGMSGTGKSSVVAALSARGYRAIDTDADGISELVEVDHGETTGVGGGQDWVWNADRVREVLAGDGLGDDDALFLAGCSPNQGAFYRQFDHIILLSAAPEVIAHRLARRTTNPFGQRDGEIERTLAIQREIEPRLRATADHEIDTRQPLDEVAAAILRQIGLVRYPVTSVDAAKTPTT